MANSVVFVPSPHVDQAKDEFIWVRDPSNGSKVKTAFSQTNLLAVASKEEKGEEGKIKVWTSLNDETTINFSGKGGNSEKEKSVQALAISEPRGKQGHTYIFALMELEASARPEAIWMTQTSSSLRRRILAPCLGIPFLWDLSSKVGSTWWRL
jgi:hypothetical protein